MPCASGRRMRTCGLTRPESDSPADASPATQSTKSIGRFFAAYFAYVGLFSPYLSLWLNGRGFSPAEIGLLISPLQWMRVIGPPIWGWLADHAPAQRVPQMLAVASGLAAVSVVFLVFDWSFWGLCGLLLIAAFLLSGQVPTTEALALQASGGDLGRYGRIRLWGSVGFIAAVALAGAWFDQVGIEALPWTVAACLVLVGVLALRLPPRHPHALRAEGAPGLRMALRSRRVRGFLVASFLMLVAHAPLYTLFSLWLEQVGYSRTEIGLLWTLGVMAEVLAFRLQHRLFSRVSVAMIWQLCFAVTAIRFAMIGVSAGGLWWLLPAQLLHAVTFGLHHTASVALVREWFPAHAQGRGQALYTMSSYGLGGSLGGVLGGWLYEWSSPEASYAMAVVAALAGAWVARWAVLASGHRVSEDGRQGA